jgi:eukaryotic-like serine/threonine-protein kinase
MSTATDPLARLRAALAQRYHVEREIARGGMATVYLAQDLKHHRRVARKVLHPELSTTLGTERFLREIATTGQLVHPHILALFDSGDADGLLYYVMPYVEGESLRHRLDREGPLPVEDAVRIACEVAGALTYAHERGIIHRDIKPENILLTGGGHACVADFGLARAIYSAANRRLTTAGLTVGSPRYISPEQASGGDTDVRTDLYSLGCVLFEMLTGRPPFEAEALPELLTQHLVAAPPHLQTLRPSVPPHVAAAVDRSLLKNPGERFPDAQSFVKALGSAGEGGKASGDVRLGGNDARRRVPARRRLVGVALGVVAALLLVLLGRGVVDGRRSADGLAGIDTTLIAVLPFAGDPAAALEVQRQLGEEFGRWQDIRVVDPFLLQDALARYRGSDLTPAQAQRVARALGAGRIVRGDVARAGGGWRIHASLYPVVEGVRPLAQRVLRLERDLPAPGDATLRALADSLLFHHAPLGPEESPIGTTSAQARLLYARAIPLMREWDVAAADSLLTRAVELDPSYARATAWLAQWKSWTGDQTIEARTLAERAVASASGRLSDREQRHAAALVALLREEYPTACAAFDRLLAEDGQDFAAAFNLGECIRRDRQVLRDPGSPSGWRFRSSYHQAVRAYRRAFELWPGTHRGFSADAFQRVRSILLTGSRNVRPGQDAQFGNFVGFADWVGDSLLVVPYAAELVSRARSPISASDEATARQRALFHEVASGWSRSHSRSAEAVEALAVALELLNDPAALPALQRARSLADSEASRVRLAASEAWLRLKWGVPDRPEELSKVRSLADSLLSGAAALEVETARALASLAILTGRIDRAADLLRSGAGPMNWPVEVPLAATQPAQALLAYAAVGGPADSMRVLEARVETAIGNLLPSGSHTAARMALLHRAAILGFPVSGYAARAAAAERTLNPRLGARTAMAANDTSDVRAYLHDHLQRQELSRPADLQLEVAVSDAVLLMELGDTARALRVLDRALSGVAWFEPAAFADAVTAGSLIRAMKLRTEIGSRQGQSADARRWATALTALWEGADTAFQPLLGLYRRPGASAP